jgi:DNA-binding ferritin-like protein
MFDTSNDLPAEAHVDEIAERVAALGAQLHARR